MNDNSVRKTGNMKEREKNEKLIKALLLYCMLMEDDFPEGDTGECLKLSPEGRKNIRELLSGWLGKERAEALIEETERVMEAHKADIDK